MIVSEAQYAYYLKKRIIPLRFEHCQPSGWLGLVISSELYYSATSDEELTRNLSHDFKRNIGNI